MSRNECQWERSNKIDRQMCWYMVIRYIMIMNMHDIAIVNTSKYCE